MAWLWTLAGRPAPTAAEEFSDVRSSAWFADAVAWAAGEGLVSGFSDGTYRPSEPVNRAQLASMLWNLADRPVATAPATFSDIGPGAWHAAAIAWLTELGYADGFPNGTFRPLDPVKRAQGVSWLHTARQFDDVAAGAWYAADVDWARYREVVEGFEDHTFRGDVAADRATTVGVLWQLMDAPTAAPHAFSDVTPGDPAVSWASAQGIVNGFADGTFRPAEPVNRAQAVMMLWNVAGRPAGAGAPPYTDVGPNAWFAEGLSLGRGAGPRGRSPRRDLPADRTGQPGAGHQLGERCWPTRSPPGPRAPRCRPRWSSAPDATKPGPTATGTRASLAGSSAQPNTSVQYWPVPTGWRPAHESPYDS